MHVIVQDLDIIVSCILTAVCIAGAGTRMEKCASPRSTLPSGAAIGKGLQTEFFSGRSELNNLDFLDDEFLSLAL